MVSSCKSFTYNIYRIFYIIHMHLYTQSQKHHIPKWIHLNFWGFAVRKAKTHLHTFDTREGVFTLGLFQVLSELRDYNGSALMWHLGPSGILNQNQTEFRCDLELWWCFIFHLWTSSPRGDCKYHVCQEVC